MGRLDCVEVLRAEKLAVEYCRSIGCGHNVKIFRGPVARHEIFRATVRGMIFCEGGNSLHLIGCQFSVGIRYVKTCTHVDSVVAKPRTRLVQNNCAIC